MIAEELERPKPEETMRPPSSAQIRRKTLAANKFIFCFFFFSRKVSSSFHQALWLDAATNSFVEEVGAMNIFFVFKNGEKFELTTAPLAGTILPGITRDSIIKVPLSATERISSN
jgi:hypothetical protein